MLFFLFTIIQKCSQNLEYFDFYIPFLSCSLYSYINHDQFHPSIWLKKTMLPIFHGGNSVLQSYDDLLSLNCNLHRGNNVFNGIDGAFNTGDFVSNESMFEETKWWCGQTNFSISPSAPLKLVESLSMNCVGHSHAADWAAESSTEELFSSSLGLDFCLISLVNPELVMSLTSKSSSNEAPDARRAWRWSQLSCNIRSNEI